MKPYQAFLICVRVGMASSAAVETAALECGDLGVLDVDYMPESINSTNLRSCEAHPLDSKKTSSALEPSTGLKAEQRCYKQAPYGEYFLTHFLQCRLQ